MSFHCWLRMADNPLPLLMAGGDGSFVAANKDLAALTSQGEKGKRVPYHCYDAVLCTKVAKYTCENWGKINCRQVLGSTWLYYVFLRATVRNFKYTYMYLSKLKLATIQMPSLIYLMPTSCKPLFTNEFDYQVFEYIKQFCAEGGIVNCNIVIAAAKGLISHKNP